jgi:hypothetical protein
MGPSPENETRGETTSWRLCLARSRGAVRGTGGTARRLRVRHGPWGQSVLREREPLCFGHQIPLGLSLDLDWVCGDHVGQTTGMSRAQKGQSSGPWVAWGTGT